MIPKPFLLNDAIILKKKVALKEYIEKVIDTVSMTIPEKTILQ